MTLIEMTQEEADAHNALVAVNQRLEDYERRLNVENERGFKFKGLGIHYRSGRQLSRKQRRLAVEFLLTAKQALDRGPDDPTLIAALDRLEQMLPDPGPPQPPEPWDGDTIETTYSLFGKNHED